MRPYYAMVVLWGARYRQYFTEWCLPSLLAPGNIPALPGSENVFLIVCPDEEWTAMQAAPAFRQLRKYMQPRHLGFHAFGDNPCKAMGQGHQIATQRAFAARAYGIQVTPDLMFSDGLLCTAMDYFAAGAQAVLTAALRFSEPALRQALQDRGWHEGQVPLSLTARELAAIGMQALHPETQSYEWGRPGFSAFPSACWRRTEDGMICASMSWAPILMDYGAITTHDTHALVHWSMDGDYVYRNFRMSPAVRMIRDTDEGVLLSWTPVTEPTQSGQGASTMTPRTFGKWFNHRAFDPLKRQRFWQPVRWHARDLTPAALAIEAEFLDELAACLQYDWRRGTYYDAQGQPCGTLDESFDQYQARARQHT